MAETIGVTRGINTIVIKGYNPTYIVERRVNGVDIYPGKIITNYGESTQNTVDLCDAGEPALGVALEHTLNDGLATTRDPLSIDTVYADTSMVRVGLIGSGMTVVSFLGGQTTTTTVYGGSNLVVKSSGNLQLPTAVASSTTTTLLNDLLGYVGKSIEYNTGGTLANTIALVI